MAAPPGGVPCAAGFALIGSETGQGPPRFDPSIHIHRKVKSVKTPNLLAACLALALPVVAMSQDALAAGTQARSERGELVRQIVLKWGGHVQEAYRMDVGRWANGMGPVFGKASLDSLRRAADARTFDQMNNELLVQGGKPGGLQASMAKVLPETAAKVFGDADKDLIFVPVAPCRIIDTRVAGGPIAANTTRNFDVTAVSNYSFQGGAANDCGGVGSAGSFAAAALNITVTGPTANGYITAFPYLGTQPLASNLNYVAGQTVPNFAIVKLDQGPSAAELSIYSFAQTHLVVDIVGYFRNPGTLAFECVNSGEQIDNVSAGSTKNTTAPVCPSGYTQTGTNCESSTWQMPFVYFSDGVCSAQNNSAGTAQLRASRTCCRARYN